MYLLFQLVQVTYWLALATWFGGVLFVAICAPVIFRTIGQARPLLPAVLSANLENQHASLLAGSVVAAILGVLVKVELGCAAALLATQVGQWVVADTTASDQRLAAIVRAALFVAATGIVIYDWRILWPRIVRLRRQYIDHADEPEIANPVREQFDACHRRSVSLMSLKLFLLLGMILFSGGIAYGRVIL